MNGHGALRTSARANGQRGTYGQGQWKGKIIDTNASVTLVSTEGRREWIRILCSVTANTSSVTAFSGPRFWSSVENFPPLSIRAKIHSKNPTI